MTRWMVIVLAAIVAVAPAVAMAEVVPGSLDVRWNAGAADCDAEPQPPLQVHAYEPRTFILRQNPCAHFEANFLYLLVGSERALLIDTGAVEEPALMPLADTVLGLLPDTGDGRLPLLVAHGHGHRDHRAGDAQFASIPGVEIVPTDTGGMRAYFGFAQWPEGVARVDLGERIVDVLPAPGHHPNHVVFYDRSTGLLFSGDFLLPGRLMIDDIAAYRESAGRIADFAGEHVVAHVLGGHVELDAGGRLYRRGAHHHPDERPLALSVRDLQALPAALDDFNGFYARHPGFVLTHPVRNLLALAVFALALLVLAGWGVRVLMKRRRRGQEA